MGMIEDDMTEARRAINKRATDSIQRVEDELFSAMRKHGPMKSGHEAYAVILEELEEYWDQVKCKTSERDTEAMYAELVQIAAMAARAAVDLFEAVP